MLTKREVAEIMLRPQPMPTYIHNALINEMMRSTAGELMAEFKKTTQLTLIPARGDLYMIKY